MYRWHNYDVVSYFNRRNCILDTKQDFTKFNINPDLLQKHNIRILFFKTDKSLSSSKVVLTLLFREGFTLKNTTYTILCRGVFLNIFRIISTNHCEVCFFVDNYTSGVLHQIKSKFKRSVMINRNDILSIDTHNFHRSKFTFVPVLQHSKLKCRLKTILSDDIVCKMYGFYEGDIICCSEFPIFMNCGICEYYLVM